MSHFFMYVPYYTIQNPTNMGSFNQPHNGTISAPISYMD